ncbi:glycosyltransferase family 2 protein [Catenulispora subtropica]|uniref:Glycosyltransferase 2-like domain-containing protein n=1 Tax=Catenulispora subtropica TaxID=450798 RepID=A0ABP5CEF9_9ACTN
MNAFEPQPSHRAPLSEQGADDSGRDLVDVMMPYYGDVGMMQEAVRSVLAQQDPHWRLTVVDDGAEPGVPEWFAELTAVHGADKIRYQRNETNLGITENFQKCLSLVTQPLVTMIGSDDRMLPNYVGTVRALMRDFPQASLAQPGVEIIDEKGELTEPWVDKIKSRVYAPRVHGAAALSGESLAVSLLRGNWMYFPAICWRADVITEVGFDPALRVVQDLALTLAWVRAGAQIVVSDTACFQYRRHAVSVSSERAFAGTRFTEERAFFLDEAARMDDLGWHKAARAARLHLSSRIHAATLLPSAMRRGNASGMRTLAGYAFGPARRQDGGS